MKVFHIKDPSPVWDKIKSRMMDDNQALVTEGEFVGVFDDEDLAGAFLIKRWSEHCFEIHGGIDPDYFGQGVKIVEELGRALFTGTPCLKIVVFIPEFNHLMRRCVQKAGMIKEGIIRKSFLKWFRLHDQYIYGICKGEVSPERLKPCQH